MSENEMLWMVTLASLFVIATMMAVIRGLGKLIQDARAELELAESEGRLGERGRCLMIVKDLRDTLPSQTVILDRVYEEIRSGE
jgi:hypothetical protein